MKNRRFKEYDDSKILYPRDREEPDAFVLDRYPADNAFDISQSRCIVVFVPGLSFKYFDEQLVPTAAVTILALVYYFALSYFSRVSRKWRYYKHLMAIFYTPIATISVQPIANEYISSDLLWVLTVSLIAGSYVVADHIIDSQFANGRVLDAK